MQAGANVLLK